MEPLERKVYLNEICLQCDFARQSFEQLTSSHGPEEEFFRASHSFLVHAANVSRLIWPPQPLRFPKVSFESRRRMAEERGKELRRLLCMPESSADHLLGNRDLRNFLEHFDHRLDQFLQEKKPAFFADLIVRPLITDIDVPLDVCLRVFATLDVEFVFLGTRFALRPLAEALTGIRETADRVRKSPTVYER